MGADFGKSRPIETRNSAIADKPRDAFRGQSNMVPFHITVSHSSAYTVVKGRRSKSMGNGNFGVLELDSL